MNPPILIRHVVYSNDVDVLYSPVRFSGRVVSEGFLHEFYRWAILLVALALMFDGHWILQRTLTSVVCRRTCARLDGMPDKV